MSRNIFEDLQTPFPSAPTDPGEPAVMSGGPGGEAPPPYSTLPASAAVEFSQPQPQWSGSGVFGAAGFSQAGMKLSYMDFVPRLVRKRIIGKDEYESFSTLLSRANTWLADHANLQLISCETVTWLGSSHKEIFSDSSVFRRISGVTTYVRGIRIWHLTKLVPSPSRGTQEVQIVQCLTFPARVGESFAQLMKRTNDRISEATNSGRIVSVETIRLDREEGVVNTESTIWKEDTTDTKQFIFAIRVFSISQQSSARETIGYQDFVPDRTARSKDNRGYELHIDVMERAGRWIARQQGVRFTNLQTVPIKIKKDTGFEERCSFTEHGRHATMYLHIVRSYFVIKKVTASAPPEPSARLTFRTFSPVQIASATGNVGAKYEDARMLLERIHHWLQMTGAHLFSIETLPVRMSTSGNFLGPNATFVPNRDGNSTASRFLYHIRIYLNGDYMEPPAASALVF